jgi:hypothetical protein
VPAQLQNSALQIGTLNESPLHAALKTWYAQPGDRFEVPVDGFVVDIVHGDLLVEIQTGNFAAIKRKLTTLVDNYPVRLVYPIARDKWLVKLPGDGRGQLRRRKSPKHGAFENVFEELVSFPKLLSNPNFAVEVLLIQEEQICRYDVRRRWRRRGWITQERRLLQVMERQLFETPADMGALVPPDLAEPFTTANLADAIGQRGRVAQKMAYCLRKMGALTAVGKQGNAILYTRAAAQ